MKDIFHINHVEVMRLAAKATRRGDIAELDRLTRIAERLHRMMHRYPSVDHEFKLLKNEERRIRTARLKHWTPSTLG
jgi:hypothetical protein